MPLSSIIFRKTQGNPFFVIELLKTLYRDNLLGFTQNAGWVWDLEAINQTKATDNVVELLSSKFVKLPDEVQEKLKMCACLGSNFDIEILSELFNKTLVESAIEMSELVNEGFITFSGNYFKFIHDRVQEIIYSFIGEEEKNKLHFKIGKFVLKEIRKKDIGENLFYVANQLNYGSSLLTDQNDKNEVAELNLLAGKKAKESTAYVSAINYLQAAMALLTDDSWERDYSLAYSIHRELAECEYLNGNFTEAENIFSILLKNAVNNIDRANVYNIIVILYTNIGEYDKALEVGIEGLRLFGIKIQNNPGKISVLHELIKFKWNQRRIKLNDSFLQQEMTDPDKLASLELLTNVGTPAFYSKPKLFVLVVFNIINYYFKYGNTCFASPSYIALGAILGGVFGDYDQGYNFGQFALLLNEKYNNSRFDCQVQFMFAYFIQHWKKHAANDISYFRRAYRLGLESGNLIYASRSINFMAHYRYIIGNNLDDIFSEFEGYENFIKSSKDPISIHTYMDSRQLYYNLKGLTDNIYTLNSRDYNEDSRLHETRRK